MATATKNLTYEQWISMVDRACFDRAGLSIHDLNDYPLLEWFEDRMSAKSAAAKAIRLEMHGE